MGGGTPVESYLKLDIGIYEAQKVVQHVSNNQSFGLRVQNHCARLRPLSVGPTTPDYWAHRLWMNREGSKCWQAMSAQTHTRV